MTNHEETSSHSLERLGYTVNEAKVYLALLKIGSSFAGRIAKETELDRSSTYNALKGLVQRGVVSTVHQTKRTTFVPENPKKIIDHFEEKKEMAKNIIPKLQEQFHASKQKKSVKLFQGYKGVKTIMQDIIDSSDETVTNYVLGSGGQFNMRMPHYAPLFRKKMESKKIKNKILVRQKEDKIKGRKFTEYKIIPSDIESPATINIYDDKVAILIWEEIPQTILIQNKKVSKTLETYFKFMWENTKKI